MHVGPKKKEKQIDLSTDLFEVFPNEERSSDDL
jgi:hypothetical protein